MKKKVQFKGQDLELGIGESLWVNMNDLEKVSSIKVLTYLQTPRVLSLVDRMEPKPLKVDDRVIWFPEKLALDYAKATGDHSALRGLILEHKPINPIIESKDGKLLVRSTDVANEFVKDHDNVLRDIRTMDCSREFTSLNFEVSTYVDSQGVTKPCYLMTRDGFSFLVMGFTGKMAARFKEAYINAFNRMEHKLRNRAIALPSNYIEALKALVVSEEARMIAETQAEENQEKAEIVDLIVETGDNYTMQQAANVLGSGRKDFFTWLRANNYLQSNNEPYQKYIRQSPFFVVKERPKDGHVYHTPFVTPRGLAYFAKKFSKINKSSKTLVLFNPN